MAIKRKYQDNSCHSKKQSLTTKRSRKAEDSENQSITSNPGGTFTQFFSDLKDGHMCLIAANVNQVWQLINREASEEDKKAIFDLLLKYLTEEMLKYVSGDNSSFECVAGKVSSLGILATESLGEDENLGKILFILKDSLVLEGVSPKVTVGICKWCELWCKKNYQNSQEIGFAAFDYASKNISSPVDVKRLKTFESFITPVDDQILRIAESSHVLKVKEGVRLVAKFISGSEAVSQLHKVLKKHMPGASKSNSKALGDIYLKGWKTSQERDQIEDAIQDLMHCCILANRSCKNQVFQPLLWILNVFHDCKNDRQVQSMVAKLYGPLLWRNLRSGNAKIRQNAAEVLFDAFPIEKPEDSVEERSKSQEMQVAEMITLLQDDFPEVRKVAASGVCKVLAKFWQIFSSDDVNKMIRILLQDFCFDASSAQCRVAAVDGMRHILKNTPRSHVYLKQVLPRIAFCLHDINEKVRMSVMNLLIQAKNVKLIQFWDICSVDNLLAQLVEEKSPSISYKIVALLSKSFFPVDIEDEDEKIKRCIFLLKKNRSAARKFYRYCDRSHELHHWIKFMLAVLLALKRFVKKKLQETNISVDGGLDVPALSDCTNTSITKGRKRKLFMTQQTKQLQMAPCDSVIPRDRFRMIESSVLSSPKPVAKDSEDYLAEELAEEMTDEKVVAGLLDIVCVIWMSRSKEIGKQTNVDFRKLLEKRSAKMLLTLFKYYRSSEVCRPLVYISSFLPHSVSTVIAGFCLSKIRGFKLDKETVAFHENDCMTTYLDAACNWKRGDDLIDIVIDWINSEIKNHQTLIMRRSPPKRRSKGVRFDEGPKESKVKEAFVIIFYLIRHPVNRVTVLRKHLNSVKELQDTLQKFLPLISNYLKGTESIPPVDDKVFLQWSMALDLMFRIAILTFSSDEKQSFFKLISWAKENLREVGYDVPLNNHLKTVVVNAVSTVVELDILAPGDTEKVLDLDMDLTHIDLLMAISKLSTALINNGEDQDIVNQVAFKNSKQILLALEEEQVEDNDSSKSLKNAMLLGFQKYPQHLLKPKILEVLASLKESFKENGRAEIKGSDLMICQLVASRKITHKYLLDYLHEYVEQSDVNGLMSSLTLCQNILTNNRRELKKMIQAAGARRDVLAAQQDTDNFSPLNELLEASIA